MADVQETGNRRLMTDLIRQLITVPGPGQAGAAFPDLDVRQDGAETIICRNETGHWPEDYVSVEQRPDGYAVCECHRDKKAVRAKAGSLEETAVLAAALALRMFGIGADPGTARQIRGLIEQGHEGQAACLLAGRLDQSLYSIRKEDPSRVSLVKRGKMADVRFAGRTIVKGASRPRAYAALYHYGRMLGEARGLTMQAEAMGLGADARKVLCLCLFGDAGQDREI